MSALTTLKAMASKMKGRRAMPHPEIIYFGCKAQDAMPVSCKGSIG